MHRADIYTEIVFYASKGHHQCITLVKIDRI